MIIETIIYVALLIALFSVCDNSLSRRYYVPVKVVCSASFIVILLINYYYSGRLWLIFWALLACFVGDLLLGLYNTHIRKQYMVLGIIAFMLGHVGLLNYMCRITEDTSILVYILPLLACGLLLLVKKQWHLHMGRLLIPCLIYCYFVTTMTLKAVECGIGGMSEIAAAGILFLLSDFTILFLYFYHFTEKNSKKMIHYVNLATYYMAILLFVYSL